MLFTPSNQYTLKNSGISEDVEAWEQAIDTLANCERVDSENWQTLVVLLGTEEDSDSYLTSPLYYAYTGRKGLWLYREHNTFIPFCWHPNVTGRILVFPTLGAKNETALHNMLFQFPMPPAGLYLARNKVAFDGVKTLISSRNQRHILLTSKTETVLDWQYPVRVLDTAQVANMVGHDFMHIRNRYRQTRKYSVESRSLQTCSSLEINKFIWRWSEQSSLSSFDIEAAASPYLAITDLVQNRNFDAHGLAFFVNGSIQSIVAWDISNQHTPTANIFINLTNTAYKGLSEYGLQAAAKTLSDNNIKYMNLGGSETKSLDDYKNKYVPAYSLDLTSIDVSIRSKSYPSERSETIANAATA